MMSRPDDRVIRELFDLLQAFDQQTGVPAGNIRPSDRVNEQRVTGEEIPFYQKALAAGGMAGCVQAFYSKRSECDLLAIFRPFQVLAAGSEQQRFLLG
jgi:hypothetical protein